MVGRNLNFMRTKPRQGRRIKFDMDAKPNAAVPTHAGVLRYITTAPRLQRLPVRTVVVEGVWQQRRTVRALAPWTKWGLHRMTLKYLIGAGKGEL
jgi:hypothetical protein